MITLENLVDDRNINLIELFNNCTGYKIAIFCGKFKGIKFYNISSNPADDIYVYLDRLDQNLVEISFHTFFEDGTSKHNLVLLNIKQFIRIDRMQKIMDEYKNCKLYNFKIKNNYQNKLKGY